MQRRMAGSCFHTQTTMVHTTQNCCVSSNNRPAERNPAAQMLRNRSYGALRTGRCPSARPLSSVPRRTCRPRARTTAAPAPTHVGDRLRTKQSTHVNRAAACCTLDSSVRAQKRLLPDSDGAADHAATQSSPTRRRYGRPSVASWYVTPPPRQAPPQAAPLQNPGHCAAIRSSHLAHVGAGFRLVLLHERLGVAGGLLVRKAQLPGAVLQPAQDCGHLPRAAAAHDLQRDVAGLVSPCRYIGEQPASVIGEDDQMPERSHSGCLQQDLQRRGAGPV